MGKLIYEGTVHVDFDDRVLAHLQLVIGSELRRGEAFHFSWRDDISVGDGRTTIWVHPRCSLGLQVLRQSEAIAQSRMDRCALPDCEFALGSVPRPRTARPPTASDHSHVAEHVH